MICPKCNKDECHLCNETRSTEEGGVVTVYYFNCYACDLKTETFPPLREVYKDGIINVELALRTLEKIIGEDNE